MNDAILAELQSMHGTLKRIAAALEGKSETPPGQTPAAPAPKPSLRVGSGLRLGTPMKPMAPQTPSSPSVSLGGVKTTQTEQRAVSPPPSPPPKRPEPTNAPRPTVRNAPRLDIDDDIPF